MIVKIILCLVLFAIGELIVNKTLFKYMKNYFVPLDLSAANKKFLGFEISVFKGSLERFVLFVGLLLNFSQVLIVFGALKIGTRFDKNNKVQNDYFIIGNFSSILISIFYTYCYGIILEKMAVIS